MLRAGFVILVMVMAGAASSADASCFDKNIGSIVRKQAISLGGDAFSVVVQRLDDAYGGNPHDATVTVSVFANSSKGVCSKPVFRESVEGGNAAHADALNFSWFRGMDIVRETGVNSLVTHRILVKAGHELIDVTPKDGVGYENGGFFFGPLKRGRGAGLAVWNADWSQGDEGWPLPFIGALYRWDGSSFQKIDEVRSSEKFSNGAAFARFMGLVVK